jgi:hypothetical protein
MEQVGLTGIQSKETQPGTAKTGEYLPLVTGQTVCTVKNEKGERCQAHVKQWQTAPAEVEKSSSRKYHSSLPALLHNLRRASPGVPSPQRQKVKPVKKTGERL